MRTAALAALVAAFFVSGCRLDPPQPPTWPTPTPSPMATPEPSPAPPAEPVEMTTGTIRLDFRRLHLAPLTCADDVQILATITGELEGMDLERPVLELSLMGNTSQPCLSRPCNRGQESGCGKSGADDPDLMGLRVRYTANIAHDADEPEEEEHCGEGLNYHHRLALGRLGRDGSLSVWVTLEADTLTISTPVDAWSVPVKMPGTMSLGRVILGAPWPRREMRGWGWDTFSAHRWAAMSSPEYHPIVVGKPGVCP